MNYIFNHTSACYILVVGIETICIFLWTLESK